MKNKELIQKEVDKNYEFFEKNIDSLMEKHDGEFVLIRNSEFIEFYDNIENALEDSKKKFPDGTYSIQEITNIKTSLGIFDYAIL